MNSREVRYDLVRAPDVAPAAAPDHLVGSLGNPAGVASPGNAAAQSAGATAATSAAPASAPALAAGDGAADSLPWHRLEGLWDLDGGRTLVLTDLTDQHLPAERRRGWGPRRGGRAGFDAIPSGARSGTDRDPRRE